MQTFEQLLLSRLLFHSILLHNKQSKTCCSAGERAIPEQVAVVAGGSYAEKESIFTIRQCSDAATGLPRCLACPGATFLGSEGKTIAALDEVRL